MNLIYIGQEFYEMSKTIMSSLYTEAELKRSDWGFVNIALREGKDVHIRQVNDQEMAWAHELLGRIVAEFGTAEEA